MKTIVARHVSPENFKEFGKAVLVSDAYKPDAQSEIQTYYGQLAVMKCDSIQIGICVAKSRPFIVDELEQHAKTAELLAALKGDFITPVATSVVIGGKERPDMENIKAVRVNQGEGIVFNEGIWHWTPYAATDTCDVLVGFKTGTPQNDFISCKLEESIEIK